MINIIEGAFKYEVRLPSWFTKMVTGQMSISNFNEVHIWVIETFGLPGHKFEYQPEYIDMVYRFKYEKDAVMFSLRWT